MFCTSSAMKPTWSPGIPTSVLYANETGLSLSTSAKPEATSSDAIDCLNRWLDVIQVVPLLATTSLSTVKQSVFASAVSLVRPAKLTAPLTDKVFQGEVVPMPSDPLLSMVSVEILEVAVPATVVVAKYKFPPAFLKAHCENPAPAESASWEVVVDIGFKSQVGVEVP